VSHPVSKTLTATQASSFAHLASQYGTPLYVYEAATIREQYRKVAHFDTVRFAQKACSNIHILRLLRSLGASVDCVSSGELERALKAGFVPGIGAQGHADIVYTADVITVATLKRVMSLGVPINAGSEDMVDQIAAAQTEPGYPIWLRVNPGFGHGHSQKTNTGGASSKHGIWHGNLHRVFETIKRSGLQLVGLHMHIGSGADMDHLARVCDAMTNVVRQATGEGINIQSISGGGGLSIPYRTTDRDVDPAAYFQLWDNARKEVERVVGHAVGLELEPGRFLVAQSGFVLTEVRAGKTMGANHFTLVDAGFNDLMRPAMYGAHHEISIVPNGHSNNSTIVPTIVAGPLCESGDVFTQNSLSEVLPRDLPQARIGDLLVIHDCGAYAASMASNYNSRPLAPEVLLDGGEARLIRRRQTIEELLALEDV
jgi:diaminopimelate decarboxylase